VLLAASAFAAKGPTAFQTRLTNELVGKQLVSRIEFANSAGGGKRLIDTEIATDGVVRYSGSGAYVMKKEIGTMFPVGTSRIQG